MGVDTIYKSSKQCLDLIIDSTTEGQLLITLSVSPITLSGRGYRDYKDGPQLGLYLTKYKLFRLAYSSKRPPKIWL